MRSHQISIFDRNESPSELIRTAIMEKPSGELRRGYYWHIGNVISIDSAGLYFALGRTTSGYVERYDSNRRDFVEEEFETAPYTHVLLDTNLQVSAIAKKPKLAPTTTGIARQLARLLGASRAALDRQISFELAEIKDPEDFIENIRRAYAIKRFSVTFSPPNPFDVEQDFHAPMENLLRESYGDNGKTSVSGQNLNPELLENLARSTAATGDDAEAKIQFEQDQKPILKKLRGNPAVIDQENVDSNEDKISLLSRLRALYNSIRRSSPERSIE
jgi:hypothetical protein